ncbi:MAG: cell division protein FtsL [bacterium]
MNLWVVIYKITWVLIAVVLVCIAIGWGIPKYNKYRSMQAQQTAKLEEKQLLEEKIRRLQLNQARFSTESAFVERTARNEGMIKSNETLCKMTDGQ